MFESPRPPRRVPARKRIARVIGWGDQPVISRVSDWPRPAWSHEVQLDRRRCAADPCQRIAIGQRRPSSNPADLLDVQSIGHDCFMMSSDRSGRGRARGGATAGDGAPVGPRARSARPHGRAGLDVARCHRPADRARMRLAPFDRRERMVHRRRDARLCPRPDSAHMAHPVEQYRLSAGGPGRLSGGIGSFLRPPRCSRQSGNRPARRSVPEAGLPGGTR
jgi:hypothetical protein